MHFRQQRVGERGVIVGVLKFRSMRVNPSSDTEWNPANDAVTRIGRVLRVTGLDELPQLWNILRGDMSLVGPRPERPFFVEQFKAEIPRYDDRHRVPVGLTGLAQVHGLRGDTSIDERARLDNQYIENWSLWRDVVILFQTVTAVFRNMVHANGETGKTEPSAVCAPALHDVRLEARATRRARCVPGGRGTAHPGERGTRHTDRRASRPTARGTGPERGSSDRMTTVLDAATCAEAVPDRRTRSWGWPFGLTLALGALTGAAFIGRGSLYLDETVSGWLAVSPWHTFTTTVVHREPNMAFYYLLLRAWAHLGHGEAALRSLSLLASVLALGVIMLVTKELFGARTAVICGVLLAVDPLVVEFAQDARGYALSLLLVSASSALFVRGIVRHAGWPTWAGYVVLGVLAAYTNFWAALVPLAHYVSVAFLRRGEAPVRRLVACAVGFAVLLAPLGLMIRAADSAGVNWAAGTSAGRIFSRGAPGCPPRGAGPRPRCSAWGSSSRSWWCCGAASAPPSPHAGRSCLSPAGSWCRSWRWSSCRSPTSRCWSCAISWSAFRLPSCSWRWRSPD